MGSMGAKDGYVEAIKEAWGLPYSFDSYHLNDPGPWGVVWKGLVTDYARVADYIESRLGDDPKLLWRECYESDWGIGGFEAAAKVILRLASTHGGCEIGGFKGRHKLRPNVDGFIPSRASLAHRVRSFSCHERTTISRLDISDLNPSPGDFVYIDPPYNSTTKYEVQSLDRPRVIDYALRLAESGCNVCVSESSDMDLQGWRRVDITNRRVGQYRKNSKSACELLFMSPIRQKGYR
tara:strand:+ start:2147 stop:2854 length:708 start_codon:yes stop_codon:yes gene_type:complete